MAVVRLTADSTKRLSWNRTHHLTKTFWSGAGGWADQQLPDGTEILVGYSPARPELD
jgi:hypothetical protein